MRPLIDSHLDLAWNALYFDRDLRQTVAEIRASEAGLTDELSRGRNTVTLPELRRARVAVFIGTLMARSGPGQPVRGDVRRVDLDYPQRITAYAHAKGQLAYYRLLEEEGHIRLITDRAGLKAHWAQWSAAPETTPMGMILSIEGADAILSPAQAHAWWADGLRFIGPVHYKRSQYASGTGCDGPLTPSGRELLGVMQEIGMTLDVTHFCDTSFYEALDLYHGPILASHHNCRALVPGDRQFSDEQFRLLFERDAVIGTAFDAWMLQPGWVRGQSDPSTVSIAAAADHIDHLCQLAGSTRHCAIGSDLDGGFGTEQTPGDLDTITDLHQLESILEKRGYSAADLDGIFFGNWLRFFERALP